MNMYPLAISAWAGCMQMIGKNTLYTPYFIPAHIHFFKETSILLLDPSPTFVLLHLRLSCRTSTYQHFFLLSGCSLWDALPPSIKEANSHLDLFSLFICCGERGTSLTLFTITWVDFDFIIFLISVSITVLAKMTQAPLAYSFFVIIVFKYLLFSFIITLVILLFYL